MEDVKIAIKMQEIIDFINLNADGAGGRRMKAILKSTTNAQMLNQVGKKFLFYNKPLKNQPFACYGIDTKSVIFSSEVVFIGSVGSLMRVQTQNSEYMFEVVG